MFRKLVMTRIADIETRVLTEAQRETSQVTAQAAGAPADMLTAVFDQSPDCIKILTPEGRLSYMNYNGRCAMEIACLDDMVGKSWWTLWPQTAHATVRAAIDEALSGKVARFTAFCPTAKGSPRWWEVGVSPVFDSSGHVSSLISISRDITKSKRDQDALEVMALEMRHRLRNAFAVSGSIAKALAPRSEPRLKAFADDLVARYGALSIAQGKMLDAGDGVSVRDHVSELAAAFSTVPGAIRVGAIPVVVTGEATVRTLALVLGELGTNSVKHGALGRGGHVELWGEDGGAVGWRLRWREVLDDPAAMSEPGPAIAGSGTGMDLMRRMAQTLGGEIETVMAPAGLDVTLSLPSERPA